LSDFVSDTSEGIGKAFSKDQKRSYFSFSIILLGRVSGLEEGKMDTPLMDIGRLGFRTGVLLGKDQVELQYLRYRIINNNQRLQKHSNIHTSPSQYQ